MSVAATLSDAAVQQLPCSLVKKLESTHLSRVAYKYSPKIMYLEQR